jgi:hypothetical protein
MESCLTGFDKDVHDFFLFPMGQNVANHPTGQQAQMLSRVIQHVVNVGDRNVRLSQAAQYAAANNITVPANELMDPNLDVADQPDAQTLLTATNEYLLRFGKLP